MYACAQCELCFSDGQWSMMMMMMMMQGKMVVIGGIFNSPRVLPAD